MKKKQHNGKRAKKVVAQEQPPVEGNSREVVNQKPVDETMIKHLQTTLSMLEERKVSRREVIKLIEEMRQRSIDLEKELGYLGSEGKNKPG